MAKINNNDIKRLDLTWKQIRDLDMLIERYYDYMKDKSDTNKILLENVNTEDLREIRYILKIKYYRLAENDFYTKYKKSTSESSKKDYLKQYEELKKQRKALEREKDVF